MNNKPPSDFKVININSKPKEVEDIFLEDKQSVIKSLESLLELAKDGKINHIMTCYELLEPYDVEVLMAGNSIDIYKMYYTLDNMVPSIYEDYYMTEYEGE